MHRSARFAAALLAAAALTPLGAHAAVGTFDVDLSGTGDRFGNQFRVFGTLTLDPDLPVGSAIVSSSLQFQRNAESPFALPSIPNVSYNDGDDDTLDWVQDGTNLYITRTSPINRFFAWNAVDANFGSGQFALGGGSNPHQLFYDDTFDFEIAELKAPSGPDGPNGFLVGTLVPEPSSLALLALGGVAALRRRRA